MINTAIEAAKAAGKILMEKQGKVNSINLKSDASLVTEADIACERRIKEILGEKYPGHGFIGEEEGESKRDAEYVWIIDPLDGTHNYIYGSPIFGVSIALAHKKEIVSGVVYLPALNRLFAAEKGKGGFVNGKKLEVSARKLKESTVSLSSGDLKRDTEYLLKLADKVTKNAFGARMSGCAAYNIANVATKRFDVMISCTCNIWDVAAGIIIVQEANGLVTDFKGGPANLDTKGFLATNKVNHEEALELVR